MVDRRYIVPVVGTGAGATFKDGSEISPPDPFRPSIADMLSALKVNWIALDLRTTEEQVDTKTGKMMITVRDPSEFVNTEILATGAVAFDRTDSKASLETLIGTEGAEEKFDVGAADEWIEKVHRVRRTRFKVDRRGISDRGID